MTTLAYRYRIKSHVRFRETRAVFTIAQTIVELLHGWSQLQLDVRFDVDETQRTWLIHADSDVGRDLNRLFIGMLTTQCGENSFVVERCDVSASAAQPMGVAA